MTKRADRLTELETDLMVYRMQIATIHRILDAVDVGTRGDAPRIRVAALCEQRDDAGVLRMHIEAQNQQIARLRAQHIPMDDARLAAIQARLANCDANTSQDSYVVAMRGGAYQLLQHAPEDIRALLDEIARLRREKTHER